MPQEKSQGKPTKVSPKVERKPYTPEVQAKIDAFNNRVGPAFVESLRNATKNKPD